MKGIVYLVAVSVWVSGVVLAKGFWLTALALFIPFYAWYLVIERAMQMYGVI